MIWPFDSMLQSVTSRLECHVSDPGFSVQIHLASFPDLQCLFVVLSGAAMMLIRVRVMLTGTSVVLRTATVVLRANGGGREQREGDDYREQQQPQPVVLHFQIFLLFKLKSLLSQLAM